MNLHLPGILQNPRLLVGNRWRSLSCTFPVTNPATGALLSEVPLGDTQLMDEAVTAAHYAFQESRQEPAHTRTGQLQAIAQGIESRFDAFAHLIVAEAGKPIRLAEVEVRRAILTFQLAAEEARHQQGAILDLDATPAGTNHFGLTRRFPVGPIAALSPFNFPLNLVAHKVAPALAAGNTLVLKPSPHTPLTALLLADTAEAAGLPPGKLNVVTCPNEAVPSLLSDPRIRMVSFTGSATVGWALQRHCAGKRCTLELGGNAAVIVHSDADLDSAIPLIASGAFGYSGQSCISVQRVLVHKSLYAEFSKRLLTHVRSEIRMGDPLDPAVVLGPMIAASAVERTQCHLSEALELGARVLCGGKPDGLFLPPTILENVPHSCALSAEEVFAPVLTLEPYGSFEEALSLANASRYGLQIGIFTRDFPLAWSAFVSLEAGAVLINQVPTWRVENMPYGGVKDSGLGREGIAAAIQEMTEPRSWIWKTQ